MTEFICPQTMTEEEIVFLLQKMDCQFTPHLSEHIDLLHYSIKLSKFANFITDPSRNSLIAFYINASAQTAYIPLVWVDESLRGKGISKGMFATLFDFLKTIDTSCVSLEVRKNNTIASNLYKKMGFYLREDRNEKILMSKIL